MPSDISGSRICCTRLCFGTVSLYTSDSAYGGKPKSAHARPSWKRRLIDRLGAFYRRGRASQKKRAYRGTLGSHQTASPGLVRTLCCSRRLPRHGDGRENCSEGMARTQKSLPPTPRSPLFHGTFAPKPTYGYTLCSSQSTRNASGIHPVVGIERIRLPTPSPWMSRA